MWDNRRKVQCLCNVNVTYMAWMKWQLIYLCSQQRASAAFYKWEDLPSIGHNANITRTIARPGSVLPVRDSVEWFLFQWKLHRTSHIFKISPQKQHHCVHHPLHHQVGQIPSVAPFVIKVRSFGYHAYVIHSSADARYWQYAAAEE